MKDDFGRSYLFRLEVDGISVARIRSVEGLGMSVESYRIRRPDGSRKSVPVSKGASNLTLHDLTVDHAGWDDWLREALNDPSKVRDVTLIEYREPEHGYGVAGYVVGSSGIIPWQRYIAVNAYPIEEEVGGWDREADAFTFQRIVLEYEDLIREDSSGSSSGATTRLIAWLGKIPLYLPERLKQAGENKFGGGIGPGFEGDGSQWVGGSGRSIDLEAHLSTEGDRVPEDDLAAIVALASKSPETDTLAVVTFTYGKLSVPVCIHSWSAEEIRRNTDNDQDLIKVNLRLQQRYTGPTSHTSREQKGVRPYLVTKQGETCYSIAANPDIFNDGYLAHAIAAWNPRPLQLGPCLPVGTLLTIPPWDEARRFQQ